MTRISRCRTGQRVVQYAFPGPSSVTPPVSTNVLPLGWRMSVPLGNAAGDDVPWQKGDANFYQDGAAVNLPAWTIGDAMLVSWQLRADGGRLPFGLKADSDVFKNYFLKDKPLADLNKTLDEVGANGMPLWQSLVLGFDPANANAKFRIAALQNGSSDHVTIAGNERWHEEFKITPSFSFEGSPGAVSGACRIQVPVPAAGKRTSGKVKVSFTTSGK